MEQPSSPDGHRLAQNTAIAQQMNHDFFTPEEPEDIEWFEDTSKWRITYMTSHKVTGEELYAEYYKDDPRSRRIVPEDLSLPAIMIDIKGTSEDKRHIVSDKIVSTYATISGDDEFLTTTQYWFDMQGKARRVTSTELMKDEKPGEEAQTIEDIEKKVEITPLDSGEYEVIQGKLAQFRNGEFEDGEYGGDISST